MKNLMKKLSSLSVFIVIYLIDLVKAAFLIAWDVVTISERSKPGFITVPLDARTDLEIMLMANLITFSPGTMVVALSEDRRSMTVHTMFLNNEEEAVQEIKERLERRLLEVLR